MSILTDIKDGLRTRLETISGLRVYNQPMDSVNQFPAAIVLTERVDHSLAFGGTAMQGSHRVIYFSDGAVTEQSIRDMDTLLHPGNSSSVPRAIYGDRTLGGNVDGVVSVSAENIGVRVLPDSNAVVGADFVVRWMRS